MWIEAPATSATTRLSCKELDGKGEVADVHVAEFNHNKRAEVTKKTGAFLLRAVPALKEVKDGGPPEEKAAEAEPAELAGEAEEEVGTDA